MWVTLRLGLHDLLSHIRIAILMAFMVGIALGVFAILMAYRNGLAIEFNQLAPSLLTVQESQSFGEIYGSRISSQVKAELVKLGYKMIVPEIHDVTGTTLQNATLLRGVDLNQYTQVEHFSLVSGRALQPGDPSRLVMLGSRQAEKSHITQPGETYSLRGRDFTVVGIFHTGTYVDNEAWISLADAQTLLGWGEDVSIYIIPDGGALHEGDTLLSGISIARKGEGARTVAYQYQPVLNIMGVVALAMGIATALALTNILLRLAWLRRREMAILRTTGFSSLTLTGYLMVQSAAVTLFGILLGGLITITITGAVHVVAFGFTINPVLDTSTILTSLAWISGVALAGTFIPSWWLSRLNLAQLLRSE